jgi:preprotein translocase subunit SecY
MLKSLLTALQVPELRNRIRFVFFMFFIFVLGLHIPVPGANVGRLAQLVDSNVLLQILDTFSGGAFRKFTIFALGIQPYINASIIMQLMTFAIPEWEKKVKEGGEAGRKEINRYTRYLTVVLAFVQGWGIIALLKSAGGTGAQAIINEDLTWVVMAQILITMTGGTAFLMWMAEQITERGIGNGVSMMIFVSIMARLPYDIEKTAESFSLTGGGIGIANILGLLLVFAATVCGIVFIALGTRRIPVQHARRQVGQKIMQGGVSYLPFKVNQAGVIPIIFAISILLFPAQILSFVAPNAPWSQRIQGWLTPASSVPASIAYALLIFAFTYFYTAVAVKLPDLVDNFKKHGSFIPGVRPGRSTHEYLDRVLTRITFAGAAFLAIIGLMQYWTPELTGVTTFSLVGGTSLLIVVGVALETMQQIDAHLTMRQYEGFIKKPGAGGASAPSPVLGGGL